MGYGALLCWPGGSEGFHTDMLSSLHAVPQSGTLFVVQYLALLNVKEALIQSNDFLMPRECQTPRLTGPQGECCVNMGTPPYAQGVSVAPSNSDKSRGKDSASEPAGGKTADTFFLAILEFTLSFDGRRYMSQS